MPKISLPSVQSLLVEMSVGGQSLSTGTAFVCASPKGPALITNWHNVTGRHPQTHKVLSPTGGVPDTIHIVHNRADKLGEWLVKTEPLFANNAPRWLEHPQLGNKADIVALPLSDLTDVQLYPHEVAGVPTILVNPSDAISVVGFPFGLQAGGSLAVWATGFMASEPMIDFEGLPIFLVDCRTRPGQSGSAVIAHRNGGALLMEDGGTAIFGGPVTRFLGVYSGRINENSDIGLVWKVSAVAELLAAL